MLRWFGEALRVFPFSSSTGGASSLRVYAIEYAEPPLVETYYAGAADADTIVEAAGEFLGADCAYLANGFWDLWQRDGGWKLIPAPALVGCFGPDFQNDFGDHLRVELGLDAHFLPEAQEEANLALIKSNVTSVLRLARELDAVLPVRKRRLWSESGEDFAEQFRSLAG